MEDNVLTKEFVSILQGQEKQIGLLANMIKEMQNGNLHKTAGTVHDALRMHGNGGIFSTPGLSPDILTAHVRPYGIHSYLPSIPSNDLNPIFGTITGFTATTGSQPSSACGDAPTGYMKGCNLTARYGLKRFDTNTMDLLSVAKKINRGDFSDLMVHGQLLSEMGLAPSAMSQAQIANFLTVAEMIVVGHSMEMALSQDIWQGTVATTFPGLDVQIATGQVDSETNVACTALDSDVKSFAWNDVCGTTLDIVTYITMMMRFLKNRAEGAGLNPVQWVIVMRPQLWDALSDCWPCRTMSSNCTNSSGTKLVVVNDNAAYTERVRIRQQMVLPIDGDEIPVVKDTGIYEYANGLGSSGANLKAGEYASSIYFLPLTVKGGFQVTYMNYINYNDAVAQLAALPFGAEVNDIAVTDGGRFGWAKSKINYCFKYALRTEQRVVLLTPHLAGKLQYVKYVPLQHYVEPDPTSIYARDGGSSLRGTSTHYAVWDGSAR